MKTTTFVKAIISTIGLTLGANSLLAAPVANDYLDQYFRAKIGRNTPVEEARLRAEGANTAYRADTQQVAAPNWIEQHLKAKLGRYSPTEETRIREERASVVRPK